MTLVSNRTTRRHARRFASPSDEIDYQLEYEHRLPDYLNETAHYEFIGEALGSDPAGSRLLRQLIVEMHDRINGVQHSGDLKWDLILLVDEIGDRVRDLVYEPICSDVDYDRVHGDSHAS